MQLRKQGMLILIIISLLLQSCEILKEVFNIEGSFDSARHKYDGDSYSSGSVDKGAFGINFAIMYSEGLRGGKDEEDKTLSSHRVFKKNFYASTTDDAPNNSFFLLNRFTNAGEAKLISSAQYIPWDAFISTESQKTNFKNNLYVLTGLMYVQKNSKDGDVKVKSGYLQIPLYALYSYSLENKGTVFGGLGPYVAYGIGGKTKGDNFSVKTFDKKTGFKRFDAGLSLTAGYNLPVGLSFRIAYDLGLADIDRIEVDHTKNRSFSFNIGYPISKVFKK